MIIHNWDKRLNYMVGCNIYDKRITLKYHLKKMRLGPVKYLSRQDPFLSSFVLPPTCHILLVLVITRYSYSPSNILITSQYINYWPCNLSETRRGISLRRVRTRLVTPRFIRPSSSSFVVLLHHRPLLLRLLLHLHPPSFILSLRYSAFLAMSLSQLIQVSRCS